MIKANIKIIQNNKTTHTHTPYISSNTLSIHNPSNTSNRAEDITNKAQGIRE